MEISKYEKRKLLNPSLGRTSVAKKHLFIYYYCVFSYFKLYFFSNFQKIPSLF